MTFGVFNLPLIVLGTFGITLWMILRMDLEVIILVVPVALMGAFLRALQGALVFLLALEAFL